jgi:hypothetical protein
MAGFDRFVVLAAMRTGSNLLETCLNQYPGLRCHGELFNPAFIGHDGCHSLLGIDMDLRARHPDRLLAAIRAADPGALHGFRLFAGHDQRMIDAALADPRCAKIVLRRAPLESWLSVLAAQQTGQWTLSDGRKRLSASVRFDADAFAIYCADLDAWYGGLERQMRLSGQTWFPIRHEECKDVAVLNGLAGWLGLGHRLDRLKQVTKRQNLVPLRQRIENFADFEAWLSRSGYIAETETLRPEHWPLIRATDFLADDRMLLVRLPGVRQPGLEALLPDARRIDAIGRLAGWRGRHPGLPVVALVRPALARALDVFQRQVLLSSGDAADDRADAGLRRVLARHHGIGLPPAGMSGSRAALEAAGFGIPAIRTALGAWLDFVAASLQGRTPVRTDAAWQPQVAALTAVSSRLPVSLVLREGDLAAGIGFLAQVAGLPRGVSGSLPGGLAGGPQNSPQGGAEGGLADKLPATALPATALTTTVLTAATPDAPTFDAALPFAVGEVATPALTARAHEVYAADFAAFGC